VRFLGQVGDHFLEIAGNVADGHILLRQLVLEPLHLRGEPLRQGPDRLVLRLFDQLALAGNNVLQHREERGGRLLVERQVVADPLSQVGSRPR
jgi:hypothetical protein